MPSQKKKSIKKTNKGNKSIIPQSNPINNHNNTSTNHTNNSTNTNSSSNVTESFSFGSNLLHQNNKKTVTSNTSSSSSDNMSNNHNNNNDNSNLESCTAVNEDPTVQQLIAKDKPVVDWMLRKANAEKQKLQKQGARVKILRVKNTSLIRQTEQEEAAEEEAEESSEKKTTTTTTETTEKKPIVEKILNRVELDCLLDFEHVVQLMVSEPEICEVKTERNDFYYVNVILLMSNGSFAYLFPYLYHKNEQQVNALQHWALINNQLKRTDISIDSFEQVHQDE